MSYLTVLGKSTSSLVSRVEIVQLGANLRARVEVVFAQGTKDFVCHVTIINSSQVSLLSEVEVLVKSFKILQTRVDSVGSISMNHCYLTVLREISSTMACRVSIASLSIRLLRCGVGVLKDSFISLQAGVTVIPSQALEQLVSSVVVLRCLTDSLVSRLEVVLASNQSQLNASVKVLKEENVLLFGEVISLLQSSKSLLSGLLVWGIGSTSLQASVVVFNEGADIIEGKLTVRKEAQSGIVCKVTIYSASDLVDLVARVNVLLVDSSPELFGRVYVSPNVDNSIVVSSIVSPIITVYSHW